jgi:hypothetical protein
MRVARPLSAIAALVAGALLPAAAHAAATPQIAAFDRHNGTNFDIGLVNTSTGGSLLVPSSVNTAADEFHPALSPDGRYLVFTRATLVPQPDGDIVPPAQREVLMLDRQTGTIRVPITGRQDAGAGATIVSAGTASFLSYGMQVDPSNRSGRLIHVAGGFDPASSPPAFKFNSSFSAGDLDFIEAQPETNTVVDVPHAAVHFRQSKLIRATQLLRFDQGSGSDISSNAFLFAGTQSGSNITNVDVLSLGGGFPRHATPRTPDGHVALDTTTTGPPNIRTIQFPGATNTDAAPNPINTSAAERMPAWSADGTQLGFIRTTTGATPRRQVLVYDGTQGVQTIQNPAVDIGPDAAGSKLRAFQTNYGGLSLAPASSSDSVIVSCGISCSGTLSGGGATGSGIALTPTVSTTTRIGIIVARRTGTRRLFGRRVARIKAVGRVPLGKATKRRPLFRWNGRVNGRRLRAGTYVLTFRALTSRGRILATSNSLQFRINKRGKISGVRRLNR